MSGLPQQLLVDAYLKACDLELQAFKPGNVSDYAEGHDMTTEDFRRSAQVSVTPLCDPTLGLGEKIYYAIAATRAEVGCNTNLGIVLLAAPLLQAASHDPSGTSFRDALRKVLQSTTIADAVWAFKAIGLAAPGGLGKVDQQDVQGQASVTLTAAMALAAEKDRVARQYLTDYQDIFDFAVSSYYNGMDKWRSEKWSAVLVYASLLGRFTDSHVVRKYGDQYNALLKGVMQSLHETLLLADFPDDLLPMLHQIDQQLKARNINPGTTADMTVATLLTVFLEQAWR